MYTDRPTSSFVNRHIGPSAEETKEMLSLLGIDNFDELLSQTIPQSIRMDKPLEIGNGLEEHIFLNKLKKISQKNKVFQSYIGLGYYPCITPSVLQRNVFENPGWYTQYTPYQSEISQGRLESLLNFQTMLTDLTAMEIANASLLDEATAAAETMTMFYNLRNKSAKKAPLKQFLVSEHCFPQTKEVILTRAKPLGIEIIFALPEDFDLNEQVFGMFLQYPNQNGQIQDYSSLVKVAKEKNIYVGVASDLMALCLLTPPGEWGVDAVVGNTQRFGVPMGYGGPHAAFFATRAAYKRSIPGRIIGVSVDRLGNQALRMALQTREQHIKREKATSNICTAQALLANLAGFYAVYHGPQGLQQIAQNIHQKTQLLVNALNILGIVISNEHYFDTIEIQIEARQYYRLREIALVNAINFRYAKINYIGISINETTTFEDIAKIVQVFAQAMDKLPPTLKKEVEKSPAFPNTCIRKSNYLEHPVFNSYHTETEIMRYIKRLENKDLSLTHSMIPLGSCTMKLNAATQLMPVSWEAFNQLHPFAPIDQTEAYQIIFDELSKKLAQITGFDACSLQPNSGAQGEYAGLMIIKAFHEYNNEKHRDVVLIPSSAHGTNPASAVMSGCKVVVVKCDEEGSIDLEDLKAKAEKHADKLAAMMITYPSTHGVFEENIQEATKLVHQHGGKVYMDGANMNAQVGLTNPGIIGADVCHLNLHKTFAIPHGGGGPGMGPICCSQELAPFLPTHGFLGSNAEATNIGAVSAAPWGSASILLVSYAYIQLLGSDGLTQATQYAILNANYIKSRLEKHFDVLYAGKNGRVAHELILDFRDYNKSINISVEDIAKRLMDYGFHAPTVSFPVPGTIMIEPTESENKVELDRFCEAMISIKAEIQEIIDDKVDKDNNVLKNAPHILQEVTADEWLYPYSRQKAAYPLSWVRDAKFWPTVARVSNSHGDRNLICNCPPIASYEEVNNS